MGEEVKETTDNKIADGDKAEDASTPRAEDCPEFQLNDNEQYMCIKVAGDLTPRGFNVLVRTTADCTKAGRPFFLDFQGTSNLAPLWSRFLVQAKNVLKAQSKTLVMVHVDEKLKGHLNTQGVDVGLTLTKSMEDAVQALGLKKTANKKAEPEVPAIDVRLVNPFLESAIDLLASMAKSSSRPEPIFAKSIPSVPTGDLCGVIPVNCPSFHGCIIISFPKDTLLKLTGKILGTEPIEVDASVLDALGEATNIIFTRGKSKLNTMGFGIESALPKVYSTNALPAEVANPPGISVVVPFQTDIGPFTSEIRTWA